MKVKWVSILIGCAVVAGALASLKSRRTEEVQLRNVATSPGGQLEARIEDHVYGPHFGGETPAVEVRLKKVSDSRTAETVVFQAESEIAVAVQWVGNNKLQIRTSSATVPGILLRSSQGVTIEVIKP